MLSWVTLYPQWFLDELELLSRHYPQFRVDERRLNEGTLILWGTLTVRPPGGAKSHPVAVFYPQGTPFEHPIVVPIEELPNFDADKPAKTATKFFDRRHQMPDGNLCLFQRETRAHAGGNVLDILQILRRAEEWFLGFHTGRWPPDSAESELEAHFRYGSDVLLAERFFAGDVRGRGRFYTIPDLRRLIDRSPEFEDGCPRIVTAMTEESGIIKVFDARSELAEIYPWIDANEWDPNTLAARVEHGSRKFGQLEQGYWWTLDAEPQPFRDGEGLLGILQTVAPNGDSWKMIQDTLGGELATGGCHYFGLQYPARTGGMDWLFLVLPHATKKTAGAVLLRPDLQREFAKLKVFCYRAHSIRKQDLWRRNQTVIAPAISDKVVGLIGLGALGSRVAELLAQAGVRRIRLCDSDRLKPANVARHIGGISDFGATKARIVASRLRNINPKVEFYDGDLESRSADGDLERLAKFISSSDLVISTTADENVESVINEVAVAIGKPVLYGRALRRASMGRIFLVRPRVDACKSCLGTFAQSGRMGQSVPTDWIDIHESSEDVLLHECGRPVIAGSAADLSFISTLTARIAIDFLEGNVKSKNHWIWSRSPAADVDGRLGSGLSTFEGNLAPIQECFVCRTPPIRGVVIRDEIRDFIISETEQTPNAETGGVLIGFIDEANRAVITRATGPGPKAIKTAVRFNRDVEHVQNEINRAAHELGAKGAYIGEWHSHLESAPSPSPTDVQSLSGIAAAPHYLTSNPVMLIVGYDPAAKAVQTIASWVFVPTGRFFPIPNDAILVDPLTVARDDAYSQG